MSKLSNDQVGELFNSLEVSPIRKNEAPFSYPRDRIYVAHPYLRYVTDRAGLDHNCLYNTLTEIKFPRFSIKPTETLLAWIRDQGLIYGDDPDTVDDHYYLEAGKDGNLLLKYQQIIGTRELGEITEDQREQLIDRMARLLAERESSSHTEGAQPSRPRPRG